MALVGARTLIAPTARALLEVLSRQAQQAHPLLFTLSSTVPPESLPTAIERLCGLTSKTSIGCLSAPLRYEGREQFAASMVWLDSSRCMPFRSTIPGRERVQVGRRVETRITDGGSFEEFEMEAELDRVARGDSSAWADVWAGAPSGVPEDLESTSPSDVSALVMLTDDAPEGLLNTLQAAYPAASKMALHAVRTPFVTGRPFTLLHNGDIHSKGALGFALLDPMPTLNTRYDGLITLSPILEVTAAEGNLIHSIADSNPSQMLLDLLRIFDASLVDKEDQFVLGVSSSPGAVHQRAFRITSGDPKRGSLALENDAIIEKGSFVQFFKLAPPTDVAHPAEWPSISFMATHDADGFVHLPQEDHEDVGLESVRVFENAFLAGSDQGWTVAEAGEKAWACSVPKAIASMIW